MHHVSFLMETKEESVTKCTETRGKFSISLVIVIYTVLYILSFYLIVLRLVCSLIFVNILSFLRIMFHPQWQFSAVTRTPRFM